MWAWIKKQTASAWAAGVAWIKVPANQKTAVDAGKNLIDGLKK